MKKTEPEIPELTRAEVAIYGELIAHKGQIVETSALAYALDRVRRPSLSADAFKLGNLVAVHIGNLRKKLSVEKIETVRGVGYRLTI